MEIRARYVLIGLFVLAVLVGGFGFVYWLNYRGGLGERTLYRIAFNGSVSGLTPGSSVLFNGMDVGEVVEQHLLADAPGQVMTTIAVDRDTSVRADTHVGLVFGGLTGTASVALVGGSASAPALTSSDGEPPLLTADTDAMKDLTQSARDTLAHIDKLVTDNSVAVTDAIASIDTFAAALARNSAKVDGIFQGLEKLTGGGKAEEQITYDVVAPTTFPALDPLPTVELGLIAPTTVVTLDTTRIIVATAAGEAPAFPEARLADNIPNLVQARVVQGFENAHYVKVGPDSGDITPDYKLAIDIRRFGMKNVGTASTAEIELSAKLIDADGKVVDARLFTGSAPASASDTAEAAAKALNQAFGTTATDLIVWTLHALGEAAASAPEPAPAP